MSFLGARLRIETEEVPATLWVFVVVLIVWGVIAAGAQVARPQPLDFPLLTLIFTFGFAVLILRRSQVIWTLIVIASASTIVTLPLGLPRWSAIVVSVFDLCLLLSPPTWRFIWSDRPDDGPAWQLTGYSAAPTESDRVDGWYVDPDDPKRIRYWSKAAGKWLGDTRIPRKFRESWRAETGS